MTRLAFVNARIIDPASGRDAMGSLVTQGGVIESIDTSPPTGAEIIDAQGQVLAPGLIDALAYRADMQACRVGGICRILLMPDQCPLFDDSAIIEHARHQGSGSLTVHPLAAATRGLAGEALAEFGLMQASGAAAVATGRRGIENSRVMYAVLQYASGFGLPVVTHAEDCALTDGVVATQGECATRLGLSAAPPCAESIAAMRDICLARESRAHLHIAQVTTQETLDLVRAARGTDQNVSCGINVAHLLLNDNAMYGYRSFTRLSPPLRAEQDRLAMVEGLRDGTIDMIVSGHDPRTADDKRLPFAAAAPGMAGAATLLSLALTAGREAGMSMAALLALMTCNPARIFGLPGGRIAVGEPADLILFDPHAPWRITVETLPGIASNTPFDGFPVEGRVLMTVKDGHILHNQ